ncbi:Ig domain-containing protein [Paenibacillus sp. FSL H3-0286]|uniref:Ig-like domain-containing protein n=1 Tax=Paenibacillus sp. FSL H3-0286 TaxID=2921427 RepID=UPI00324A4DBC
MSKSWYLMNSSNDRVSGFELDDFALYATSGFDELLEYSPESYEVLVNNVAKKLIIQTNSKENTYQILGKLNDFYEGNLVLWNNKNYLTMTRPQYNKMYQISKIEECNLILKWIDEFGEVQSHPSVLSSKDTSINVKDGNIMSVPDGFRKISLQNNKYSINIKRDMRFIIGKESYKVTDVDYISTAGIVKLALNSSGDLNIAKDNLDLEIADYYERIANFKIEIVNGTFATIREDQSLQLNIIVTNKDTPLPSPALSYSVSDDTVLSISSEGLITPLKLGSSIITITYKDTSAQIEVRVTDSTAYSYTCEIIGSNEIKVGRTQTYTAKFYRNGVEYPDESRFSLASEDGNQTTLATISTQNSSEHACSVVAGNSVGYVWLHVVNQNGLSMSKVKIKIKPLY